MNFISPDFHLHYLASYSLLIQHDEINNYLIVLSEDNEVLVFLGYNTSNPSEESLKMLSYPFSKVFIGLPHQQLLWVPALFFNVSEKGKYASYFLDPTINNVYHKEVGMLDAIGLYQLDKAVINKWSAVFPDAKFIPLFSVFIEQVFGLISPNEDVLCVQKYDSKVDIMLILNGEFKFYNSFEVSTIDDMHYFVLSLLRQYKVTSKLQTILLSGVEQNSEWENDLKRYADKSIYLESRSKWKVLNDEVKDALLPLNLIKDIQTCV